MLDGRRVEVALLTRLLFGRLLVGIARKGLRAGRWGLSHGRHLMLLGRRELLLDPRAVWEDRHLEIDFRYEDAKIEELDLKIKPPQLV